MYSISCFNYNGQMQSSGTYVIDWPIKAALGGEGDVEAPADA